MLPGGIREVRDLGKQLAPITSLSVRPMTLAAMLNEKLAVEPNLRRGRRARFVFFVAEGMPGKLPGAPFRRGDEANRPGHQRPIRPYQLGRAEQSGNSLS